MEPELQMQFDNNHAFYDMIVALNNMFKAKARTARFHVSKAFVECKLEEGATVGPHIYNQDGWLHSEVGEARLPNWPRISH